MNDTIGAKEARKAILISQGLGNQALGNSNTKHSLKAIEALGYVQIDSISVVERAHHHTLWNRVKSYRPDNIEQLLLEKKVFEYWSHAAAYLPMSDYRFSLIRKNAIARGDTHWYKNVDKKLMSSVLDRVKSEGPLQAKSFKNVQRKSTGWWDWKPAKIALEQLYMQGDLMVRKREGFQKVYDLTERVLPPNINSHIPSNDEFYEYLVTRFLTANAIGTAEQMGYLLKGIKKPLHQYCRRLIEEGKLLSVSVDGLAYYALPTLNNVLAKNNEIAGVKILSPFDNLLIQRKRTKALFDYDYQIECYVPEAKRKVGYFSLPLLWGDSFAGRMDAKMDRKTGALNIQHLYLETADVADFIDDFLPALKDFMIFNQGSAVKIHKISSSLQTLSIKDKRSITKSLFL